MICWFGGFVHVRPRVIYILPMICKPLNFRAHIPLLQLNMRTCRPRSNSITAKNLLSSPNEANRHWEKLPRLLPTSQKYRSDPLIYR